MVAGIYLNYLYQNISGLGRLSASTPAPHARFELSCLSGCRDYQSGSRASEVERAYSQASNAHFGRLAVRCAVALPILVTHRSSGSKRWLAFANPPLWCSRPEDPLDSLLWDCRSCMLPTKYRVACRRHSRRLCVADSDVREGLPLAGARPRGLHGDHASHQPPGAPAHPVLHGRAVGAILDPRPALCPSPAGLEHKAALNP